ncbi:MAG: nucleotidyltransferase domain-containing protein [Candidatus Poribacteria bacterium]
METAIENILDQLYSRFEMIYGDRLSNMLLYGSQARGDADPESDIDVLIVLKGEVSPCKEIDRTINDVADISLENDVAIACVFVSEEQFEKERSPLLMNIHREGIIYEPGTTEFALTGTK